ncbi:hypothetical protein [Brucella pituitosa]|uniref:hypothetical protein n=1 Tax=Brucella pituitosa TaxID=571256 RepID=UPI0009A1E4B4|nr:hypothetical protein [Brucella pituitosa]
MDPRKLEQYKEIFQDVAPEKSGRHRNTKNTFNVSVFDHWLSVNEAESSSILNYEKANSSGNINQYYEGEKKFIKLYSELAEAGVVCHVPPPYRFIECTTELKSILTDSLREMRRFDLYFPAYEVRVRGGFDRTDLFLVQNSAYVTKLISLVSKQGLCILMP